MVRAKVHRLELFVQGGMLIARAGTLQMWKSYRWVSTLRFASKSRIADTRCRASRRAYTKALATMRMRGINISVRLVVGLEKDVVCLLTTTIQDSLSVSSYTSSNGRLSFYSSVCSYNQR